MKKNNMNNMKQTNIILRNYQLKVIGLRRAMKDLVDAICEDRGWQFVGKTIKGITYYSFIDCDYISHDIPSKELVQFLKGEGMYSVYNLYLKNN